MLDNRHSKICILNENHFHKQELRRSNKQREEGTAVVATVAISDD